ncbi:MAG: tRNA (adenosine(37)-N6)-threonylcarbamoyltransferase complex transferase subunit TsaD [Planctomycetes bacterium]|nr:tRNA (adenosine(37)-N6)-threonylcarbamoyltransferase complex transferase subunit TsaD [Planctomycetota bacterium]
MIVLGIETSCDETAVALVRDGREIVASLVSSQIELHAPYGGVVPEVACRAHAEWLLPLLEKLCAESGVALKDVDVIAATARPGLIGALLVGLTTGKTLALALDKPFVGVDHIDGHVHAPRMAHPDMEFPHLSLVVSGGHTEIYRSDSFTHKELIASTADDAAGECFDKVAALLGLGYPGGPRIEKAARGGNPAVIDFPRGSAGADGMAISFSGLKTAVLRFMQARNYTVKAGRPRLEREAMKEEITKTIPLPLPLADLAASFQEAAVDMLIRPTLKACERTGISCVGLTGGVAANQRLREKLTSEAKKRGIDIYAAPKDLCTDNAAFIAGAAHHFAREGRFDPLDLDAVPN